MKRIISSIIAAFIAALPILAQNDETHISIDTGGRPLESLLTDGQKATVTHLTITDTLTEDDFAYIRKSLLSQLKELNLRDADIDTIPAHAFHCELPFHGINEYRKVVLPTSLTHLSDFALNVSEGGAHTTFELTGRFPTVGEQVYNGTGTAIAPAPDNKYCIMENNGVYSTDKDTLFKANPGGYLIISEGTHIIHKSAFELLTCEGITLPETIDSIGDRAFFDARLPIPTGPGYLPMFECKATTPPKLGVNVFDDLTYSYIHVPDESLELYKSAKGWKDLNLIKLSTGPIYHNPFQAIDDIPSQNNISISANNKYVHIHSAHEIKYISLFDLTGKQIGMFNVNDIEADIPKTKLCLPYTIAIIRCKNRTTKTIKLSL